MSPAVGNGGNRVTVAGMMARMNGIELERAPGTFLNSRRHRIRCDACRPPAFASPAGIGMQLEGRETHGVTVADEKRR